jgi:hypothetical protein
MIELSGGPDHLPLQLESRIVNAPGVWTPDSRLPLEGLGALVTPPVGYIWDGDAVPWEARPGLLAWAPPRRPLGRFARRLARERNPLPRLWTLARAAPGEIARALEALEAEGAAGYLLWDALPEALVVARRVAALPLLAEVPATEASTIAGPLLDAGIDALWIGPPRLGDGHVRLWGPAVLLQVLAALEQLRRVTTTRPLIAGAGIASVADARRAMDAGASALALDPTWWVEPAMPSVIGSSFDSTPDSIREETSR